ncbi:MAG: hypothetical protein HOQ07_02455, partial [Sinomonas sp.]|nr:hypothetical protein [Sinomonas sp.]
MTAEAQTGKVHRVPFVDLVAQQREISADVVPEVVRALDTGAFIGGHD